MLAGLLIIQIANVLRLISLVYVGIWLNHETFDVIHTQFWPLALNLIALACLIFFLFYHRPPNPQPDA